jgi:hypothetical protein
MHFFKASGELEDPVGQDSKFEALVEVEALATRFLQYADGPLLHGHEQMQADMRTGAEMLEEYRVMLLAICAARSA